MKILILSDLHIPPEMITSLFKLEKYKRILQKQIHSEYDMVLISGDVFEHRVPKYQNVFELLYILFNGKPVVFCLGNHEFAYEKHQNVLKTYNIQYQIFKEKEPNSNIICLDVNGYYDFGNNRIVGNVFWYDWSLNHCRTLMKGELIEEWLDFSIEEFDPMKEHEKCREQILKNIDRTKNMILLTHTVPHKELNSFTKDDPISPFNAYSGVKDFLKEIKDQNFKFSICGHTHRREIKDIYGIHCINIGNDYFFRNNKIKRVIVNVDDNLNLIDIVV